MEHHPFGELLLRGAGAHPDRDCIVFPDARFTYSQLEDRARRMGRSLLALCVERGHRVGILMANCPDYAALVFGVSLIGAVPVLYNARFKAREIAHVTADAQVKVIVTSDLVDEHTNFVDLLDKALPDLAVAARGQAAILLGATTAPGYTSEADFLAAGNAIELSEVDRRHSPTAVGDVAMMFYTSGTTAMPKGCPVTHTVLQHAGIVGGVERLGLIEGDVFWSPLPMFHTGFTQSLTGALHVGGTFLSMTHFEPGPALAMIEREAATIMFPAFPTITLPLLDHPDYDENTFHRVRTIITVGTRTMLQNLQDRMPHTAQVTVFGMTESGGSVAMGDRSDTADVRAGSSGKALPGDEIEIRDPDTGRVVESGVKGEIVIRGVGVFSGYHNDPQKTAESFYEDGWFRTGDLGNLDNAGRVTFSGRLKDMLKVGGENVSAMELERYLGSHPAVNLAQVVGLPDEKYEEVPVAFIELVSGTTVDPEEIIEYCRDEMASFKVPRHVRFVTEWPMGATKILKYELRAQISAELGVSGRVSRTSSR